MLDRFRDNPIINKIRSNIPPALRPISRSLAFSLLSLIKYGDPDMFATVGIETTTNCNRTCSYCPVSNKERHSQRGPETISDELYSLILKQLSELNFSGKLALQGYGEPLLDPKLPIRIQEARKKLPKTYITINSNGDFLRTEILNQLVNQGLSHIYVTNHSNRTEPHKYLREILANPLLSGLISYYPRLNRLQNRGGSVDISEFARQNRVATPDNIDKCSSSVRTLTINADGSVIVCDNDHSKTDIIGTINPENHILEIWRQSKFKEIRDGIRSRIFTCSVCQNCNIGENAKK